MLSVINGRPFIPLIPDTLLSNAVSYHSILLPLDGNRCSGAKGGAFTDGEGGAKSVGRTDGGEGE